MDREVGGREGALELVGREVRDGPWCHEVESVVLDDKVLANDELQLHPDGSYIRYESIEATSISRSATGIR